MTFELGTTTPGVYLHHKSEMGEFFLSSDSVIPTFTRSKRSPHVVGQLSLEERERFLRLSYTIGGMMIFPGKKIAGHMTINGARGCDHRIKDRFDLTAECIRRHYLNGQSPLSDTLARYHTFFRLFRDFRGYVEFFLLQDLVSNDYSTVKFFTAFEDFHPWPLPNSVTEYISYRQQAEMFIRARNQRILNEFRRSTPAPPRCVDVHLGIEAVDA
ncbi:MAG: hypothetical protein ABI442_12730 [Gemmatimonadaceae bacterium]